MNDTAHETTRALHVLDLETFLRTPFPPREMVMGPVLPSQGLAMLYAPRGLGKTFFALSFACAVAGGAAFLRWQAPRPRRVLYVDGEMPAAAMRERMEQVANGADVPIAAPGSLRILSADMQGPTLQGGATLDISTPAGQAAINAHLSDVDLVILDNLASLHLGGAENEGDSWLAVQGWLLALRRAGKSALIVHHSGKRGQQRGTSRREDVLDTVIALRRPADYAPSDGARFEVHFDKARGMCGEETHPFEARLVTAAGAARWSVRALVDVNRSKVTALTREGLTVREIAEETGLSKSAVGRMRKEAEGAAEIVPGTN